MDPASNDLPKGTGIGIPPPTMASLSLPESEAASTSVQSAAPGTPASTSTPSTRPPASASETNKLHKLKEILTTERKKIEDAKLFYKYVTEQGQPARDLKQKLEEWQGMYERLEMEFLSLQKATAYTKKG